MRDIVTFFLSLDESTMKKLLVLFVIFVSVALTAGELQAFDTKLPNTTSVSESVKSTSIMRLARKEKADECKLISSSEAIKKAQRKSGGKVVAVKLKRAGKRSVYRVRVLVDKKRIKNINVKACK